MCPSQTQSILSDEHCQTRKKLVIVCTKQGDRPPCSSSKPCLRFLRLTQFERVPKAERDSNQIRKGSITGERSTRSPPKHANRKPYDWLKHQGSRWRRVPANWGWS